MPILLKTVSSRIGCLLPTVKTVPQLCSSKVDFLSFIRLPNPVFGINTTAFVVQEDNLCICPLDTREGPAALLFRKTRDTFPLSF